MNQKRNKGRYNPQFKTFISQQSCIDVFSKVQSLFLQKFFRYNISDYFPDILINVEEDIMFKKTKNKRLKQLSSQSFTLKTSINLEQLENKINNFYLSKTKIVQQGDFTLTFKFLYASNQKQAKNFIIQANQIIIMQVKMRAQNEKIQNLPNYIYKEIELCQEEGQQDNVFSLFKNYKKQSITILIAYFGDINFHLFDRSNYKSRKIMFFGRQIEVKIVVFFVSRMAMIDCFKKINKIQNMEYINDLLIQLYEFKRDKTRNRKLKNSKNKSIIQKNQNMMNNLKWFGVISLSTAAIGAILLKFVFF